MAAAIAKCQKAQGIPDGKHGSPQGSLKHTDPSANGYTEMLIIFITAIVSVRSVVNAESMTLKDVSNEAGRVRNIVQVDKEGIRGSLLSAH